MSIAPAARVSSSVSMAVSTVEKMKRSAPSRVLSATLPVKPSVTTTSTGDGIEVAALDVAGEVEAAGRRAAGGSP